jgi:hypothetical protein
VGVEFTGCPSIDYNLAGIGSATGQVSLDQLFQYNSK